MKTIDIQSLLLAFMLLMVHPLSAQKLTVEGMQLLGNDATAMDFDNQRQDLNGDYAGIVKVTLAVDRAEFEGGGVMEQKLHRSSEYWVWMAKGSKRIKVFAPGFQPLEVNFYDDYGIFLWRRCTDLYSERCVVQHGSCRRRHVPDGRDCGAGERCLR